MIDWKLFVDSVKFHEHEHTKFSYFELANYYDIYYCTTHQLDYT